MESSSRVDADDTAVATDDSQKQQEQHQQKKKNNRGRGTRGPKSKDGKPLYITDRVAQTPRQRNENDDEDDEHNPSGEPRLPKKKVALLLGFNGTGYAGMQVNPGQRTIEGDLFDALVAAGAVSKDNANDQKKVSLQRCARTDKGVHAAGQVVSLKMIVDVPGVTDIVAKINEHLPAQIRVWGYARTVKSFNPKNQCDSRMYEYMLPTYVFLPPTSSSASTSPATATDTTTDATSAAPAATSAASAAASPEASTSASQPSRRSDLPPVERLSAEEMAAKRAYRISSETLETVRQAFAQYKGSHNFHNFTIRKNANDKSAQRVIMSFEVVGEPTLINGTEWLRLRVHGQSFMMHQIRKMIGLVILLVRSGTPITVMRELLSKSKANIPKAPGLGLLLDRPVFEYYNKKYGPGGLHSQQNPSHVDTPAISFEPYEDAIMKFKQEHIYDEIVREEVENDWFDAWVRGIDEYQVKYGALPYINPEGVLKSTESTASFDDGDDEKDSNDD
ncbi:pseudouridine synthase [Ramicandelaber brevisporus]|nr:pseudouridine synthase [Ramicandelaber brevisporus]